MVNLTQFGEDNLITEAGEAARYVTRKTCFMNANRWRWTQECRAKGVQLVGR